jgi:predicted Zn-dependent protease
MFIKYKKPKKPPEGNVTKHSPLLNFAYLLGTVVIVSAVIFVALGFVADWLAVRISPETERKIGDMLFHTISNEEIVDDKRIQYLEELLESLPESGETTRLPLTIHLIKSDVINAAIMAGGHVFIHTALLEAVGSENELAFVLAHELGHFQNHDPTKSLGRSLVFLVASMALGIGTSESGGVPEIVFQTGELTSLSYSRKQERAADLYGLSRAINRYGHGSHSLDFFKRLEEEEQEQGRLLKVSQYFSTHPLSKNRIVILNKAAAEKGWKMEGEAKPLPEWLHCPNMEECEPDAEVEA